MCDYSLHHVKSRPANVGDKLIVRSFGFTRGLTTPKEPDVAVCLRPGTQLKVDRPLRYERTYLFGNLIDALFGFQSSEAGVATFTQVNTHNKLTHHDALEFPDGSIVMVNSLLSYQHIEVLQLPAEAKPIDWLDWPVGEAAVGEIVGSELEDVV